MPLDAVAVVPYGEGEKAKTDCRISTYAQNSTSRSTRETDG